MYEIQNPIFLRQTWIETISNMSSVEFVWRKVTIKANANWTCQIRLRTSFLQENCEQWMLLEVNITKTRLFKYIENFTTKKWKFSDKKNLIFFIFLLKT